MCKLRALLKKCTWMSSIMIKQFISIYFNKFQFISMFVIVGLGNPGEKYEHHRHNAGLIFMDYIITLSHGYLIKKYKHVTVQRFDHDLMIAKPSTFMNESGLAVKELFINLKLKIENLIVAHDDLDIPLGKFKIQRGIGPKLHNGLDSIEETLGTKDFLRARIGIDHRSPEYWINGEPYVLDDFTKEEKKLLSLTFPLIFSRLKNELFQL